MVLMMYASVYFYNIVEMGTYTMLAKIYQLSLLQSS
jgi:hypothetical protein